MCIGGDGEFSATIADIHSELDHADCDIHRYLLDLLQNLCPLHLWGFVSTPIGSVALRRRIQGYSGACFSTILTIVGLNDFVFNLQLVISMILVVVDTVAAWYLFMSDLIF